METRVRKKNKEHLEWRERKENYGTMEQYDGCYHRWFEQHADEYYLLLSLDDATGKITEAVFDRHEGILPRFNFWKGYVAEKGKPASIYLDKFSTYKINHKSAEDRDCRRKRFRNEISEFWDRIAEYILRFNRG